MGHSKVFESSQQDVGNIHSLNIILDINTLRLSLLQQTLCQLVATLSAFEKCPCSLILKFQGAPRLRLSSCQKPSPLGIKITCIQDGSLLSAIAVDLGGSHCEFLAVFLCPFASPLPHALELSFSSRSPQVPIVYCVQMTRAHV